MKLSYYLPTGTTHEFAGYTDPIAAFDKLLELAKVADESGFATIWAPDHFIPFGPSGSYVFEAWTTLAALAREVGTARLGQLVTGNGYRNPALLALGRAVDLRDRRRLVRRGVQGVRLRLPRRR
jgi:alkanesulfonate monooxygenase SsuD/methylene tetrahydromethanopterin reductase-like flavin-dependent oxidoreductase (luciferase family)